MSVARKMGTAGLVVVVCLLVFVAVVFFLSNNRLGKTFAVEGVAVAVTADSASVARGRYAVEALLACQDCHGEDLGGKLFIDAAAMGRIPAPNLTRGRGGVAGRYQPKDWDRAIRHGIAQDGTGLLIMPAESYTHLTDAELADVIAYLQSIPPVDREFSERTLGPIGRMLLAFGQPIIPAAYIDHDVARAAVAPQGETVARGAHLIQVSGCAACHGADLSGGKVPGADPSWPPAGNLTPHADGLGRYSEETFERVLRTGQKVDGTLIDPTTMPWTAYSRMEDGEIRAIWSYLHTVEAKPMRK